MQHFKTPCIKMLSGNAIYWFPQVIGVSKASYVP